MKYKDISSRVVLMSSLVLLIAGCSGYGGSSDTGANWGNYKCTAMSSSGSSTGWATSQGHARDNALQKCRARSANPNSCQISNCISE